MIDNKVHLAEVEKDILTSIESHKLHDIEIHPFDLKEKLLEVRDIDEQKYYSLLKVIPTELLAETIAELPAYLQEEVADRFSAKKSAQLASEMDSDDAASFFKIIGEKDNELAESILRNIESDDQQALRELISYEDDVAGAFMQKELFSVREDELVEQSFVRLRELKREGLIQGINQVFVIDENDKFVCSIGTEELVLLNPQDTFKTSLLDKALKRNELTCSHQDDIKDVVEKASDYNLSVIPVVDDNNILLGRITSDDLYDLIETQATDDMFSLAGLNADVEQAENIYQAAKNRGLWLGVNLITAILASVVVGYFDATIKSYVSLAILMPIVASMGGNAGTQSLTVTVRQLSVGEIDLNDGLYTLKKEISLSLINGLVFAVVIGGLSYFWFNIPMLGIVIALSTVLNIIIAGICGAVIPLMLDKLDIDPAVSSSVLLTTVTDIVGFLSFLGLAQVLLN